MKSFAFLLCFMALLSSVNAKWKRIVYDYECLNLKALQIFNDNLIVAVGDEGLVRLSKDSSGKNWENIFIPDKIQLLSIACLNSSTLIIGSDEGTVYKTTNLGLDWKKDIIQESKKITIIKFADSYLGFLATEDGSLFKTSNGGSTWENKIEGDSLPIYDISISKNGDIYVSGKGKFYQSKDNGKSWNNIIDKMGATEFTNFYRVKAVSNEVVFAFSDILKFYKTTDGGLSWKISILDSSKMYKFFKPEFAGFEFFDESSGIIRINDYSQFTYLCEFSTKDGGNTFQSKTLMAFGSDEEIANNMKQMTFKSNEYGFSCGSKGQLVKIWINRTDTSDFFRYEKRAGKENEVFVKVAGFSNKNFALLTDNSNVSKNLWITSDAGNSWKLLALDTIISKHPNADLNDISYPSSDNIILTLNSKFDKMVDNVKTTYYKGYIYKTTDGGNTYNEYTLNDTLGLEAKMVNRDYGYSAVSGNSTFKLIYTLDGGSSWTPIPMPAGENYLYKAASPEPGVFFIYTRGGVSGSYIWKFYRTYDYGSTWVQGNGDNAFYTMKLLFINRQTGFGISRSRRFSPDTLWYNHIWKTTDAGDTWQVKFKSSDSFYGYNFNDISFCDKTLLAVRDYNPLCISKDEGETWEAVQPPQLGTDNFVKAASMLSPSCCIAVAPLGYILYNDEIITSIENGDEQLADNNFIFPNPATDFIEVKLSENLKLPKSFGIKIFNALGEIKTVKEMSSSVLRINISDLKAGLYFLRIHNLVYKFIKIE